MRKHRLYPVALLVLGCALGACSSTAPSGLGERLGSTQDALTLPPGTGVPVPKGWGGSFAQLLVADALVSCSFVGTSSLEGWDADANEDVLSLILNAGDMYLGGVVGQMQNACCGGSSNGNCTSYVGKTPSDNNQMAHWYWQRQDGTCNNVDSNDPSQPNTIDLKPSTVPVILQNPWAGDGYFPVGSGHYGSSLSLARRILRMPSFNLCIARALRTSAPGTSGANDALTLSAADQRELLEVTRERAQMAMIEFGQLAVAFSGATTSITPSDYTAEQPLPLIAAWQADNAVNQGAARTQMGADFAAAVQLHTVVSQEIATLLARSSSAREPRGGHASTLPVEIWGPGSWRQRALASLFGGAPLATEIDGSSPWPGLNDGTSIGSLTSSWVGNIYSSGSIFWPTTAEQPFIQTDMSRPQAQRLLSLARAFNTVVTGVQGPFPNATDCYQIDRNTTAQALYVQTELALENSECLQPGGVSTNCGLTVWPTCDACMTASCCTQEAACAADPTCSTCIAQSVGGSGLPASCQSLQSFVALRACMQTTCASTCTTPPSPLCSAISASNLPAKCNPYAVAPAVPDYSGCHLYTEHGITPDHAALAASYLADTLEPVCPSAGTGHPGSGARNLSKGTISSANGGTTLIVSGDAQFMERGPMQIQPLYGRYANFYASNGALPWSTATSQGFDSWGSVNGVAWGNEEAHRLTGAVPALVATREMLLDAESAIAANNGHFTDYFAQRDGILGVINAAAGTDSVTIRPHLNQLVGGDATPQLIITINHERAVWDVTVTRAVGEWQNGSYPLYAIFDDTTATSLLAYPTTTIMGRSAVDVIPASPSGTLTLMSGQGQQSAVQRFAGTFSIPLDSNVQRVTLVASVGSAQQPQYVVLAADAYIGAANSSFNGYYLSQGGSLTNVGERLLHGQPANESKPAFDGFDLPTNWVPPTDPTVLGAMQGQKASAYYLAQAQQAAQDATAAVQQAFTDLQQETMDQGAQMAAQAKAQTMFKEASDALCGSGNMDCDMKVSTAAVVTGNLPACNAAATDPGSVMNCIATNMLQIAHAKFPVADAVALHMNDTTPPAFTEYSGGSLQSLFIQQWGAIQDLNNAVQEVNDGLTAAQETAQAAQAALDVAESTVKYDCTIGMQVAAAGGLGASMGFPSGATVTFSAGPLMAQVNKCAEDSINVEGPQAAAVAAFANGVLAMVQHATHLIAAAEKLGEVGANVSAAVTIAQQAQEQTVLDAAVANAALQTNYSVYRDYHSYDLWRAQAMVDNARRYAVAARRAIEAQFLVDLSTMSSDEAFVAAPSTWADEVYEYDMSLPAAVGLSVGTANPSGLYPNKVLDYVGNLQRFVSGYAVKRPTASASSDSDVITLLGPDTVLPGSVGPSNTLQASWSYYCASIPGWVHAKTGALLPAGQACPQDGESPIKARLVFNLDAWGRTDAYGVQAPPSLRFNARWVRLAVNLVGTGIKDCTKAADPLGCYSSSFIPYNLTQIGPSWVVDYENAWRTLNVPVGQINLGKALAAEQWLDPISNGWSQPYVQAVQRLEFSERPLDGAYQLELQVAPEVDLDKIERIQILADTSYWVRQQ